MARDKDDEILVVKAKPKRAGSAPPPSKSKGGAPYRAKTATKGKPRSSSRSSARELWLETVKSGSGALSSGRKAGQPPGKRTPTEYWMDTLRKTGEGMSTESTKMKTMSGLSRPADPAMSFLSTPHFLRQMAGTEKTPRKTNDATSKPPPGTPSYKSQEEYYEEILLLRKQISAIHNDNSTMKSKLRRTEEDNVKKEKEIEKLLDPSKSEEMRRTLADRRPDAGTVIQGLKQKIVKLEQTLKEKEASHKKLQSDVKSTKIDEMKTQLEAFYNEIVRLQQAGPSSKSGRKSSLVKEPKESSAKVRALNETILRLNDSNTKLQTENKLMKTDLAKHLDEHEAVMDQVDSASKEYVDMNRRQLIGVIAKLEKKIDKLDTDSLSIISDMDQKRRHGKVEGKVVLTGSLNDRLDQLDRRETELLEEREKHLEMIKKAKEDRSYYRKKLEEREKELKDLEKWRAESDVLGLGDSASGILNSKSGSKSKHNSSRISVSSEVSQRRYNSSEERERERKIEEFQKKRAAKVMQRSWKKKQSVEERRREEEEHNAKVDAFMKNRAARKIQAHWQDRPRDEVDATSLIQSTLRGHKNRKDHANSLRRDLETDRSSRGRNDDVMDDSGDDDSIVMIQSAFRGHLGRRDGATRNRRSPSPHNNMNMSGRKRPSSAKHVNGLDSEGESIDDDHILNRTRSPAFGSSLGSSAGKRPSSASQRGHGSGVYSSPRRRSPGLREMLDADDDDDDDILM